MDRLYRSRDDRMLAGVAGGLADMWGADPSLVRVIWALLIIFTGGIAFLVYIVMALVVPEEPVVAAEAQALATTPPPGAGADWTPPADPGAARQAAREARAAARRASGGSRSAFSASVILGGFLIILGGFFLAREFLPQIDFDWFWPLILVGIGILLVVTAMRRPSEPG
jgi:phage shock protein C